MLVDQLAQAILFAIFASLTAILSAALGPTYDGLLVPSLSPGALYPPPGGGSGFLATAAPMSDFVILHLVDPAIPLVALAVGAVYLARAVVPRLASRTEALLPRFVVAVLLANLAGPVAGALLGVAGAGYPVLAGYDGGAWRQWVNLGGWGMLGLAEQNGALALLEALVLFTLVLLLVAAVAVRDALLGVLLVLLPLFTLLYPVPALSGLARRGWTLFGQLAFLPWAMVVPLELAVGASSAPLLVGYLTVALGAPALLSVAGTSLGSIAFPSAGTALSFSTQRGLPTISSTAGSLVAPGRGVPAPTAAAALRGAARVAAAAPLPASLPVFAAELAGHGAARLLRHVPGIARSAGPRFPPVHPPGRAGGGP